MGKIINTGRKTSSSLSVSFTRLEESRVPSVWGTAGPSFWATAGQRARTLSRLSQPLPSALAVGPAGTTAGPAASLAQLFGFKLAGRGPSFLLLPLLLLHGRHRHLQTHVHKDARMCLVPGGPRRFWRRHGQSVVAWHGNSKAGEVIFKKGIFFSY